MKERIKRLIEAHESYWAGLESPLTDDEYDSEIQWLKKKHPEHWLLTKIGGSSQPSEKVIHNIPMLSLDKAYTFNDVEKFIHKVSRTKDEKFIAQSKFDGLAGKFDGKVFSTRGNGFIGENISSKIRDTILIQGDQGHPLEKVNREILGEILCSQEQFEKFGKEYKHPRNFVSGMVSRKEKMPEGFKLHLVEYSSSPTKVFRRHEFDEKKWKEILSFFNDQTTYLQDGIVIRVSDEKYWKELGATAHHPLGSIAFKYQGQKANARLLDIEWSIGKRNITPVGIITPVKLGGVIIERVTLHNAGFIEDHNIAIGCEIVIERAGDVIPHVIQNNTPGEVKIIDTCPVCQSRVNRVGPEISCPNEDCPGRNINRLYSSIREAGIDFIGQKTLTKIMSELSIRYLWQLFDVTIEDLERCDIGSAMSRKIFKSIQQNRIMTDDKFLACLCIDDIGKNTWKTILSFLDLNIIINSISKKNLSGIPNIGQITVRKIIQGIKSRRSEISNLLHRVRLQKDSEEQPRKTICFTGKMPQKRSFYEDLAKKHGYQPSDTVNKNLTVLICDDFFSNSTKLKKAKAMGVQILLLEEWLERLNHED